jgi:hypothetical protein
MVGFLLLRLHQIHTAPGYLPFSPASLQTQTGPTPCQDTHPTATPLDPWPLGSLAPERARTQPREGSTACWDTCPTQPTTLQALLSSSYTWDNWTPTPWTLHPPGPAGLQLCVEWLEPHPTGSGNTLAWDSYIHQPTRNPAPWAEPAPATVFPDNHSTRLPIGPPLEGSKHA